jgi:hypothetical protein
MSICTFLPSRARQQVAVAGVVLAAGLLITACGSGVDHGSMPMADSSGATAMPGHDAMPGMDMATGDGLTSESAGFRFVPAAATLAPMQPSTFRFRITDTGRKPVTAFEPEQTKLMHFYLVRSDLAGFQHVHPTMAADGTWSAEFGATRPGTYRAYASFVTKDSSGKAVPLVLSEQVLVPGQVKSDSLPPAADTAQVDGYTLKLAGDRLTALAPGSLKVSVSKDGKPISDLQPYLDTYAHLTAFHEGDLAFAHLHPQGSVTGDHGGPDLSFDAALTKPGQWRLFLQFQTADVVRTAAVTVAVG